MLHLMQCDVCRPDFLIAARGQSEPPAVRMAIRRDNFHPPSLLPTCLQLRYMPQSRPTGKRLYTSLEPWLAQEEKLSYRESLKDSKLSTSCLLELFKEASSFFPFSSFCPSTVFRQFFSFSNKSTLLLLNLLRDSREILDNLFWESSFVSSVCFNFCNKQGKY